MNTMKFFTSALVCMAFCFSSSAYASSVTFTYTSDTFGVLGSLVVDDSVFDGSISQSVSNVNIIDLNFVVNSTIYTIDDVVTTGSTKFDTSGSIPYLVGGVGTLAALGFDSLRIFDGGFLLDRYSYFSGVWSATGYTTPSTVPVPAAAWLFGSALLGFFGFSRRKANA